MYALHLAVYTLILIIFLPLIGYNAIITGTPIWEIILLLSATVFLGNTILIYAFYKEETR